MKYKLINLFVRIYVFKIFRILRLLIDKLNQNTFLNRSIIFLDIIFILTYLNERNEISILILTYETLSLIEKKILFQNASSCYKKWCDVLNLKSTHNSYRELRRLYNDVEFDFFHFRLRIKEIIFHYFVEQVRNQLKNLKTNFFLSIIQIILDDFSNTRTWINLDLKFQIWTQIFQN